MTLNYMEKKKSVTKFKYLSVVVSSGCEILGEIDERIGKFLKELGHLYPLMENRNVLRKVKLLKYRGSS